MSRLPYLFAFWLLFLIPAAPVAAACWFFGRARVTWFKWEYALLIAPYLVWILLVAIEDTGKSLSNAVGEPFFLGCSVALACLVRVVVGKREKEKVLAGGLFAACCLAAIALWALTPSLPE